jgi:hypothetical protein
MCHQYVLENSCGHIGYGAVRSCMQDLLHGMAFQRIPIPLFYACPICLKYPPSSGPYQVEDSWIECHPIAGVAVYTQNEAESRQQSVTPRQHVSSLRRSKSAQVPISVSQAPRVEHLNTTACKISLRSLPRREGQGCS